MTITAAGGRAKGNGRGRRTPRRATTTGASKKVTLDNLTLSRKEGFRDTVESPPRQQPESLTIEQLRSLGSAALNEYNHKRSVWHANLPTIKTQQMLDLHEDLGDIIGSNQQDGDKAKGATLLRDLLVSVSRSRSSTSPASSTASRSRPSVGSRRRGMNDGPSVASE